MTNIRCLVVLGFFLLLSGCGCNNDASVALVESLSQQRLEKLVADLSALESNRPGELQDLIDPSAMPPAFSDIRPQRIMVVPGLTTIILSGCVDDKAALLLETRGNGYKELVFSPGERKQSKTLWRSR